MQNQTPREREMRAFVREHDKGRLTWAQIADREGITISTLNWWRSEIRRRDRDRPTNSGGDFVEVELSTAAQCSPAVLEIVLLDGRSVRVPPGFDSADLRRLLTAIDAPC
jgi:hypothetical protein